MRFFQRLVDSHRWEEWKDEKLGIIPIDWLERTEQLLTDKEAMESFHDFEDHCLEPNCNWMNSHVSQKFMARH